MNKWHRFLTSPEFQALALNHLHLAKSVLSDFEFESLLKKQEFWPALAHFSCLNENQKQILFENLLLHLNPLHQKALLHLGQNLELNADNLKLLLNTLAQKPSLLLRGLLPLLENKIALLPAAYLDHLLTLNWPLQRILALEVKKSDASSLHRFQALIKEDPDPEILALCWMGLWQCGVIEVWEALQTHLKSKVSKFALQALEVIGSREEAFQTLLTWLDHQDFAMTALKTLHSIPMNQNRIFHLIEIMLEHSTLDQQMSILHLCLQKNKDLTIQEMFDLHESKVLNEIREARLLRIFLALPLWVDLNEQQKIYLHRILDFPEAGDQKCPAGFQGLQLHRPDQEILHGGGLSTFLETPASLICLGARILEIE